MKSTNEREKFVNPATRKGMGEHRFWLADMNQEVPELPEQV